MSTALGLAMQISANTAQLAQAVADVNKKLDSMGEAGKKAASDLGTLKNIEIGKLALGGIQAATTAFLSLGQSVTGAATALTGFALEVGDQLDRLNDVAQRTGIGVEALQGYGAAAKLAGTDVETFARSLQKLTLNIGQAADNEKQQKAFADLGLVFDELRQKSPTEQFEAVADAISKVTDPAERAAAAVSVFGKTGIELGPLFSEGPGALTKMREEAEKLGQVVSQEAVENIGRMNDAFDRVSGTIRGLVGQILGELAGPIATIAEDLLQIVQQAGPQQIAQNVAQGLLDFIKLAGNAFFKLAQFIEAFIKKFAPILGLDIRSEAEKELEKLRNKEAGTFRQGPGGVPQFVPGSLTPEEQRRMQELQSQVAAEGANGALAQFQANFNAALDNASNTLREKMEAQAAEAQPNAAEKKQVELLEQINRNGQVGVVEILN